MICVKKLGRATASAIAGAVIAGAVQPFAVDGANTLVKGDLNRDDRVSVSDVVLMKNYLLGRYGLNENQSIAADINDDGTIDALDLACLQDIIINSRNKLPKGTWIGDCCGAKRYFSFGEGKCSVMEPRDGEMQEFTVECDEDLVVLKTSSGARMSAFITWQDEESFVLSWENGSAETFRYFCEDSISPSQLITGHWVTSQGKTFHIIGLSGKLTAKNGDISRFEYTPDGESIVFHFGRTDDNTVAKITHTDSMHFTAEWEDGTKEVFTLKNVQVRDGITYINGILIANKSYSLPSDYNPGKVLPEAQAAYDEMRADAKKAGYDLKIVSGFRSYAYQNQLYNSYVARDGKAAADTYSARAGYSEHQTGLAMDINNASGYFDNTPEAKWLAENCYKYGFILRYPKGKENITGYKYESWHVRYLGKQIAQEVYNSGLTLEEFLCIDSKYKS